MLCARVSKSSIILTKERKNRSFHTVENFFLELHGCMDCNRILSSVLELPSNQGHVLGAHKPCSYNTPESGLVIFCYLFDMEIKTEDQGLL